MMFSRLANTAMVFLLLAGCSNPPTAPAPSPLLAATPASWQWTDLSTGNSAATAGLNWTSVATSADGTHLAAVDYFVAAGSGEIWTSSDSGATWIDRSILSGNASIQQKTWSTISMNADASRIAAAEGSNLWISTDSGATWSANATFVGLNVQSIAWSADGTHVAAVVSGGNIYTSSNGGNSWTPVTSVTVQPWSSIASSADGAHLAAVANTGDIWTSSDSGGTWTDRSNSATQNLVWTSITSSADGTHLAAVVNLGDIWTSVDSGVTWTNRTQGTALGGKYWVSITSSANGVRLAAVQNHTNGDIWTSNNWGRTWSNQTSGTSASASEWQTICSGADGNHLFGGVSTLTPTVGSQGLGHLWLGTQQN